jgi:hypothetical protein
MCNLKLEKIMGFLWQRAGGNGRENPPSQNVIPTLIQIV